MRENDPFGALRGGRIRGGPSTTPAYDGEGYFIPNALERQAIGDRDKLILNADGSLELYLQAESPGGDKAGNWLPVAKGPFNLLMRLYWPKSELLDGSWTPPPVKRVE